MKDLTKFFITVFIIVVVSLIISIIIRKTVDNSSGEGSWKQKRESYEREQRQILYNKQQERRIQPNTIDYPVISTKQRDYVPSPRSHYEELWNECEELESLLNDAGIDHDEMDYPMEYNELEDLRDEYQSLLEDNDIDY